MRCRTKSLKFVTTVAHNREQQNNNKAVVKSKRINRGGGYGLKLPWECDFTGDTFSVLWLNSKLENEGLEFKLI